MRFLVVTLLLVMTNGCLHHQLRKNTVEQAHTVEDVHTQQVLDNLAKFTANPAAMPHFSWPNAGSTSVNDAVNGGANFNVNPTRIAGWAFNFGGARAATGSYTTTPINDPRKLELMRCAYQRAISSCCCGRESASCPNCEKSLNRFYLGSETVSKVPQTIEGNVVYTATVVLPQETGGDIVYETATVYEIRNDRNELTYTLLDIDPGKEVQIVHSADEVKTVSGDVQKLDVRMYRVAGTHKGKSIYQILSPVIRGDHTLPPPASHKEPFVYLPDGKKSSRLMQNVFVDGTVGHYTEASGIATAECLSGPCWFKVGEKCDVPRNSPCCLVGEYCGTFIWVPQCGRDQLTKLTLTILDIALNDPPTPRAKEVVAYLNTDKKPVTKAEAAYKVTALIPFSSSVETLHPSAPSEATLTSAKSRQEQAIREIQNAIRAQNMQKTFNLDDEKLGSMSGFGNMLLMDSKSNGQLLSDIETKIPALAPSVAQFKETQIEIKSDKASNRIEAERRAIEYLPSTRSGVPNAGFLQFQQNLNTLSPR